jgi:uncharacterized membrane protein YjgN (DUF898 family)
MPESTDESRSSSTQKSISFVDRDPDFTFIASLGVAISLLSLGVGRFWLASNLRRYLWSNTTILGHPLVYDGDAWVELLHFAVGVAPLAGIGFVLYRLESPILGDNDEYFYLATAIFAFAYWRAMRFTIWRYRLNHTLWRGRRLRVEGSVAAYFLRAFGWGTASAISLGLAWPSAQAALNRYTLRHTH